MARYSFSDVFLTKPDGSLEPRIQVRINGVTFGPGVTFQEGVLFGGVNIFKYRSSDVEGDYDEQSNLIVITAFYED